MTPIVFDNLSRGHREFVRWGPLEEGDIRDRGRLTEVLQRYRPAAVIHFAALSEVSESIRSPLCFYDNNVTGTLCLLQTMRDNDLSKLVLSSTCAVYGDPIYFPIDETHPKTPLHPYGYSKLMVERILSDIARGSDFTYVALRYFNAAGADESGRIGERHDPETHAIPLAIAAALGHRAEFEIFGTDYDTRDGTCVRDYVHVLDLADAHSRAVRYLLEGGQSTAVNLGTGTGTTVREIVAAIGERAPKPISIREMTRRTGDAPVLVADNSAARRSLGWQPLRPFSNVIDTAWRWHQKSAPAMKQAIHPQGAREDN